MWAPHSNFSNQDNQKCLALKLILLCNSLVGWYVYIFWVFFQNFQNPAFLELYYSVCIEFTAMSMVFV